MARAAANAAASARAVPAPTPAPPSSLQLLLLGAGHCHVEVLRTLRDWPMDLKQRVRVTVVAREVLAPYSGMLPGVVAGAYTANQARIDARALAARASGGLHDPFCRVVQAEARAVDVPGKRVLVVGGGGGKWVPFDLLSVNVGAQPAAAAGGEEAPEQTPPPALVTPVKPIDTFLERWEGQVLPRARAWLAARAEEEDDQAAAAAAAAVGGTAAPAPRNAVFRVAVVGGGAGGVELSFAVAQRLEREWREAWERGRRRRRRGDGDPLANTALLPPPAPPPVHVTLYSRGPVLPEAPAGARSAVLRLARASSGVSVIEGGGVAGAVEQGGRLRLRLRGLAAAAAAAADDDAAAPLFDACLWCTQASAPAWFAGAESSGLELDGRGFLRVRTTLQLSPPPSESSSSSSSPSSPYDDVFAAGDAASIDGHPRPKAGVYAVRAGPILAENLRRRAAFLATGAAGAPDAAALPQPQLLSFVPQRRALALISLGAGPGRSAIAVRPPLPLCVTARWAWRWKDRIDRAFVERYRA
jgi:selenide, water dikinase